MQHAIVIEKSPTDAQRQELDRRLADQAANPGVGRPWSQVRARLLGGA